MKIFSEIYGAYFRIVAKVLSYDKITEKEISDIISRNGFADSMLFVPSRLVPDKSGESAWRLLSRNEDGTFSSVLNNAPPRLLTVLQKRWLKALLSDSKFRLFVNDEDYKALCERLADVKPLYKADNFRFFDRYSDGDDFGNETYRRCFRVFLSAVKAGETVSVSYNSPHSGEVSGEYLPVRLEYSTKNDKFRALCLKVDNGRPCFKCTINLGRVISAEPTGRCYKRKPDIGKYFSKTRCETPVTVEVSSQRNGIERFMTEFASYEKQIIYDAEAGKCTVQIWYDKQDETELLIQLLEFGPVLEIISPANIRREAAERIKRQYQLLFGENESDSCKS